MYIFELINKVLKEQRKNLKEKDANGEETEYEKCEHIFVPTDSTGETLACSKCGLVVKKTDLLKPNFFHRKKD